MVKLFCSIVGVAGSPFSVEVNEGKTVDDLKKAIKAENLDDPTLRNVAPKNLQLFLAKKGDAWLRDNEDLDTYLQSEIDTSSYLHMRASWKLSKPTLFGPDVSLGEDVVHVLVVVPGQRLPIAATAIHEPHPARKKRWEELNKILDRNQRAKVNAAGESSTGYSYVSFSDVDRYLSAFVDFLMEKSGFSQKKQ
ncbi:hypothetical protein PInf_004370 [Phytophthora infestans]|nr:hypothetical protein PInf_004370 [Phytophthora infestans]